MIIGLVGFAGSGKDTVADYLIKNKGFMADSFAKPLKDAACAIFGWDREMIEGKTVKSREWREKIDPFWSKVLGYDFTPRKSIQLLGTEAGQSVFGKNVWVGSLFKRIEGHKNVIVTDARFKHEIDAISEYGGITIRVKRGEDPYWMEPMKFTVPQENREKYMGVIGIHRSEWDWIGSKIDEEIANDGSLSDLYNKIDNVLVRRML